MNQFEHQWQKLTALARQAGDSRDLAAPFGFATRVVAQAAKAPAVSPWAVMERFALRGLMAAAVFSIAAVALNYANHTTEAVDDYTGTGAVVELLALS